MAELQPLSQEAERVGPGLTLSITGWVILFGVLLCVVAALVLVARDQSLTHAESVGTPVRPEAEASHVRSELFRSSSVSGEQLKAAQRQKLEHFGWVDQAHGVVRIPIDVAMDLEIEAQRLQP